MKFNFYGIHKRNLLFMQSIFSHYDNYYIALNYHYLLAACIGWVQVETFIGLIQRFHCHLFYSLAVPTVEHQLLSSVRRESEEETGEVLSFFWQHHIEEQSCYVPLVSI